MKMGVCLGLMNLIKIQVMVGLGMQSTTAHRFALWLYYTKEIT